MNLDMSNPTIQAVAAMVMGAIGYLMRHYNVLPFLHANSNSSGKPATPSTPSSSAPVPDAIGDQVLQIVEEIKNKKWKQAAMDALHDVAHDLAGMTPKAAPPAPAAPAPVVPAQPAAAPAAPVQPTTTVTVTP